MANIVFETEGVDMPALDREVVEKWIVAVAKGFGKAVGTLTYIFCDDDEIIRVNREFLKHDYYTDIITFDYSTRRRISGDMYISSADLMTRNVDRRVEIATPVLDPEIKKTIRSMLECMLNDNVKGRVLGNKGQYTAVPRIPEAINSQELFLGYFHSGS